MTKQLKEDKGFLFLVCISGLNNNMASEAGQQVWGGWKQEQVAG